MDGLKMFVVFVVVTEVPASDAQFRLPAIMTKQQSFRMMFFASLIAVVIQKSKTVKERAMETK
jgi:hypothetical protein